LRDDVESARCLDLFAGSGALSFEAASRGAAKVVQVESDARVVTALAANRTLLRADQVTVLREDALHYLAGPAETFDLVFLDPPFRQAKVAEAAALLEVGSWLTPFAKIYIETEPELALDDLPSGWALLRRGRAGDVAYFLYQRNLVQGPP
jgi:16S rRNA (guanine966-N2)-methyltransferase